MSDADARVVQELVYFSTQQKRLKPFVCFVSLLELGFQCGVLSSSLASEITVGDTVRANVATPDFLIWRWVLPGQLMQRLHTRTPPSIEPVTGRQFFVRFLALQPMLHRTLSHPPAFGSGQPWTSEDLTDIRSTDLIRCVMAYFQLFQDAKEVTEGALVQSFAEFDKDGLLDLVDLGDAFVNAARASNSGLDVKAFSEAVAYLRRILEKPNAVRAVEILSRPVPTPVPGALILSELFATERDRIR